MNNLNKTPHRRFNILTEEWILVSSHRPKRPWQGETEKHNEEKNPEYVRDCYLYPGNKRFSGILNSDYKKPFSFVDDFLALLPDGDEKYINNGLLIAESETGICYVVFFLLIIPLPFQ